MILTDVHHDLWLRDLLDSERDHLSEDGYAWLSGTLEANQRGDPGQALLAA